MSSRKKHKIRLRDPKTEDEIVRIDSQTFQIKDYMIFHSQDGRWLCDCMAFVMNIQDNGTTKPCKHIIRCQNSLL